MAQRLVIERAAPRFGGHGLRDLRKVGYPAARRAVEFGFEQPQDRDVDAVAVADGGDDRFDILPPRR